MAIIISLPEKYLGAVVARYRYYTIHICCLSNNALMKLAIKIVMRRTLQVFFRKEKRNRRC